jgi:hypothetical protein
MNENLAFDDRDMPAQAGGVNNTLNTSPAAGGGAPTEATPTTPAGKAGTPAAKSATNKPGRRTQNPLANFSSYTYKISLYMITPDAYNAFIQSGRKDINAINNIVPGANTPEATAESEYASEYAREIQRFRNAGDRGATTSPPSSSSANASATQYTNGVYLIAQSGGVNNETEKRAPGFDLDFYIDNLKITQNIAGKDTGSATSITDIKFTVTEPYGFSFLSKLRHASNELAKVARSKNFKDVQNPSRQFFILGIRFLGYDKDGYIIDPSKIPSSDGNPNGNAFGLYERFYDISIYEMNFKIDGTTVVYNITASNTASKIGYGTKRGFVDMGATILGATVYDALMGDHQSTSAGAGRGTQGQAIGLLAKLNKDQESLRKNGFVGIASEWDVKWLGDAETAIGGASIVNKDIFDKRVWAMTNNVKNSADSTVAAEEDNNTPDNSARQITFTKGGSILQCVNQIILQSDYLLNALKTSYQSDEIPKSNGVYPEDPNTQETRIRWYTMHAEVLCKGWDNIQKDFVFKTTYIIQPYETPVVVAPYVKPGIKYYGPHKRYEYWFTGKNSEITGYEQQMNNAFYNVAVSSKNPTPMTFGGGADVPVIMGKENSSPSQGALNMGLQAQNAYMTSLYNPDTYAEARIKILGDPDFLMQPSPSSINAFYNQYYGTDGFTINANGGQVFIEINFKEPKDYHNSTGLLSINQSIYFWNFPESIQKELNEQGGGIRYMVTSVVSNFSKGKFDQELFCNMSSFPGAENAVEAGAGRANQTAAISARTGVNLSTEAGAAARATFADNDPRLVNGPATTANGSASVPSSTDYSDPMGTGDGAAIMAVAGKPQVNTTVTVPTKSGPVQDEDAGTNLINFNYF